MLFWVLLPAAVHAQGLLDQRDPDPDVEQMIADGLMCPLFKEPPQRLLDVVNSLVREANNTVDYEHVYQLPSDAKLAGDVRLRGPFGEGHDVPTRWVVPLENDSHCLEGEVGLRGRTYPHEHEALGSVEEAFGGFRDSGTIYCVKESDFTRVFKPTRLPVTPIEVYEGYAPQTYTPLPLDEKWVEINPYAPGDPKGLDPKNRLRMRRFTGEHERCPDGSCVIVQFEGPFYGGCGCSPQGYTMLLDADGRVVEFLSSTLRYGRAEYFMTTEHLGRLRDMANDRKALSAAYENEWIVLAKKSKVREFGHNIDPESSVRLGAGTTTVMIHTAIVRDRLAHPDKGDPSWLHLRDDAPVWPNYTITLPDGLEDQK